MGRSTGRRTELSESRQRRQWTAQQKVEIVVAGMSGERTVREVCREHGIQEALCYQWRERLLDGGRASLAGREERDGQRELKKRIAELERTLGRKTLELEIAGKALRGWE